MHYEVVKDYSDELTHVDSQRIDIPASVDTPVKLDFQSGTIKQIWYRCNGCFLGTLAADATEAANNFGDPSKHREYLAMETGHYNYIEGKDYFFRSKGSAISKGMEIERYGQ